MAGNRAGAVGFLQAAEVPALDNAGVALTFALAGNVHALAGLEGVGLDQVAHVQGADVVQPQLPQGLLGGDVALLEVACQGLGNPLGLLVAEADLHGVVAVVFHSLLLRYHAGTGFDHGDGNDLSLFIENLRHADFLADDSFFHLSFPPVELLVGSLQHDPPTPE